MRFVQIEFISLLIQFIFLGMKTFEVISVTCLCWNTDYPLHIDGLVQERRNSSVLAMELCLCCTNPSIRESISSKMLVLDNHVFSWRWVWTAAFVLPLSLLCCMQYCVMAEQPLRTIWHRLCNFWEVYLECPIGRLNDQNLATYSYQYWFVEPEWWSQDL